MKLGEAQRMASERLTVLYQKKRELSGLLKEAEEGNLSGTIIDKVEISQKLDAVEKEYDQMKKISEKLSFWNTTIHNAEASKQQSESLAEESENLMKILKVFRRIANGDHVPPTDENKLIEYSLSLYMSAKNMAFLKQAEDGKRYKSLWRGDDNQDDSQPSPSEIAANTVIGNPFLAMDLSSGSSEAPSDS